MADDCLILACDKQAPFMQRRYALFDYDVQSIFGFTIYAYY